MLLSMCCVSGFVLFWRIKYHTHSYLSVIIPTQCAYKLIWNIVPIHLYSWISPLSYNYSDYISSRFAINLRKFAWAIWFAVKKFPTAVAPQIPCHPLLHDLSSTFKWNKTFWVFGMSVLFELTIIHGDKL